MDSRQPPQHPFSRNGASPFSRPSFQQAPSAAASQPPYPSSASHPPATSGPYPEVHARKPSEPPSYYSSSRQYPPEHGPGPMPPSAHSRHHSTSSITSGPTMTRGMPPPNSPPQQQQQGQGPNNHQMGGPYGLPQPRPPPLSVGPSNAFPRGRELPALDSLPRAASSGSSMSISSMLGGPPPARESAAPPQYSQGPPSTAPGPPGPPYNQAMHASPRPQQTTVSEYNAFRRPQTPEHHRMYENRDPRAASAASPPAYQSTPELQRYGTPQAYAQRGPPMPSVEQGRESGRLSGGAGGPRPMSPPRQYANAGPPRPVETGRPPEMYGHREELRASEEYNPERPIRVMKYEDPRYISDRERQERERQEREMELREREMRERELRERELRERERRDMAMAGVEPSRAQGGHPHEYPRQMEQRPQQYGRPPDPRDWTRPGYEPARAPYDPAMHPPRQQEYPPNAAPHYNGPPHPYGPSPTDRHHPGPHQHHQHGLPPPGPAHPQVYESPDRQRISGMHMDRPHPQQPPPRTREESAVPPPSVAYGSVGPSLYEPSRNRSLEEIGAPHQRNLLGIQEINRKGRISPLPQAVQGAQPQLAGPAGEPGIKSEFGRMFSGIGTGVGTISSPVPAGAQLAYGGAGPHRRDELDVPPEPPVEVTKTTGRGKRRKLKEEDEEGNNGRLTPVGGRAKKAKGHHHHQYVSLLPTILSTLKS